MTSTIMNVSSLGSCITLVCVVFGVACSDSRFNVVDDGTSMATTHESALLTLSRAKEVAQTLDIDNERNILLSEIAQLQACFGAAKDAADTIEDIDAVSTRDNALQAIVRITANQGRLEFAVKHTSAIRNVDKRARSYMDVAEAHLIHEQSASDLLDEVARLLQGEKEAIQAPRSVSLYADLAVLRARVDDDRTARKNLEMGRKRALETDDPHFRVEGSRKIAKAASASCETKFASNALLLARSEVQHHPHAEVRSDLYREIGIAQVGIGEVDNAFETFEYSMRAIQMEPPFRQSTLLRRLAIARADGGDYNLALETAKQIVDSKIRARAFLDIAVVPEMSEEDRTVTFGKAIAAADEHGDVVARSALYLSIAEAIHETGDSAKARQMVASSLDLVRRGEPGLSQTMAYCSLAASDLTEEDDERELFREALKRVEHVESNHERIRSYEYIASVQLKVRDNEGVLDTARRFEGEDVDSETITKARALVHARNGDIDKALGLVGQIASANYRDLAYRNIAREESGRSSKPPKWVEAIDESRGRLNAWLGYAERACERR